jgi:hypothetical protein
MKNVIFCTGLIFVLSTFAFGQKQKQTPAETGKSVSSNSGGGSTAVLESGTKIDGQLQSTLDVKNAQVGDRVVLKTTKAIKQNGHTVVAKGSKLIGRVTEVQQKSKGRGESRLGLTFDQLESNRLTSPITASIVSITNAGVSGTVGDTAEADVFGSSSTTARTSSGGSGGGLLGGASGAVTGALNQTVQTIGGVTNTATQTVGSTAGSLGRTINGIQISNAIDGSVQSGTTLSAANKNIRLEKGVIMRLELTNSVTTQ